MLLGRAFCGVAALALVIGLGGAGGVLGQDVAPDGSQESAPPTVGFTQAPESERVEPPARPVGLSAPAGQSAYYCDTPGLMVSRSLAFQSEDIAWRVVGSLPSSQVAPRLTDPLAPTGGRTLTLGSVLTSSLCEAVGSFSAVDLAPGTYLVSVVATTSSGSPVELTESLTILAAPRPLATPTPRPAPAAPSGVRATAVSSSTIRIDWIDNSHDETGFRIDGAAGSTRTSANVGAFLAGGLQANAIHCFSVYAFNDVGDSYGGTACAMTPPPRPTAN